MARENGPTRILLVDDDESIRALYSKALASVGFDVKTAQNGREAFRCVGEYAPELIILDLVMPEQEGIETLLQLQSSYPKIPVLAISGALGANEYLSVADLLGASQTLQKPIKPDQLLTTVRSMLNAEG
jgi:DNA-binding NtrC family response regulator